MQNQHVHQTLEHTFRQETGRVRAVLLSSLRDFELVEDVLQEAFLVATERWPLDGVPTNPPAWLLITARRKAIDRLRRASVLARKQELLLTELERSTTVPIDSFPDERLKLIFTCCHPSLPPEAHIALTWVYSLALAGPNCARCRVRAPDISRER